MKNQLPLTTLCYIEKNDCYLMLHRTKKKNDINMEKWLGIGGHFEDYESPEECLIREVKEETGLVLTSYALRGVVTFVQRGVLAEYMFLYTATIDDDICVEDLLPDCEEGNLVWVPKSNLHTLNLWEGDYVFFDLLDKGEPFFSLKLGYDGDKLVEVVKNGINMPV